jgi:DNA polymerase-3 subunit alpha
LVHELVLWCKSNDILVGPGRGSVGGSLIAYLIGITAVDPIKYDLLFSRFIDENRIDYPDIDMDFEDAKRPLVRQHLEELYGKNHIASVSTFMKMKGRAVIRDVSRVFDIPYKDVDEFAKAIFDEENDNNSVEQAAKDTPEGLRFTEKYPKAVDYAIRLEGQIRGTSQHAAALIVSAEDLTQGTRGNLAVRSEQEVVNWHKDDAEYVGLMKLDALGLSTLSVLGEAKRLIKQNHGHDIVFDKIALDNNQVFEMLSRGETVGVFQFNTWATTKLVKEIGVEDFGMMSAVVALVRPGPADSGMTADFTKRKHGSKWVKKHRIYERITKDTFGIIVYQEQVMQVINLVAGLPYTVADKIRKIVAKKRDAKQFAQYEQMFVEGCQKEGTLSVAEAKEFWEALQNHARYSFNKSHSVEYAMISYWCAFLKLYFPAEFICANLTYGSDGKKEELVKEARRIGLKVVLPRLGISDAHKWVVKDGNIYVPFIEVKGVGPKLADDIARYKPPTGDGFFCLAERQPSGKMGKLIEEIGADGNNPKGDLAKYFGFDISGILNPIESRLPDCYAIKKHWRDPELLCCKGCALRDHARQPVLPSFGIYNVMIVGEAPGFDEDAEGKGFYGKAGKLLWAELFKYSLTRRWFHVTNVCKCFPGPVKTPKADHIESCSTWLDKEIKMTGARLCLGLGNTALKYFKGEDGGITKLSGTLEWVESKGIYVLWCVHPSSVLRNPAENKRMFEEGIRNFANKIQSMGGFK